MKGSLWAHFGFNDLLTSCASILWIDPDTNINEVEHWNPAPANMPVFHIKVFMLTVGNCLNVSVVACDDKRNRRHSCLQGMPCFSSFTFPIHSHVFIYLFIVYECDWNGGASIRSSSHTLNVWERNSSTGNWIPFLSKVVALTYFTTDMQCYVPQHHSWYP